jgi:phosphoglycerol transferase MdoB-like AlkP superfamily enzyme
LPDQSVVLLEDKAVQLPSLPRVLKEHGYHSSFYYGGELTFANIGVWLTHQRFDYIRSGKDFPSDAHRQRWGADDEKVFEKAAAELAAPDTPFFSTIMTLSLHPPFDVPYSSRWQGDSRAAQFLNSAAFADAAIGTFFKTVKQYGWYDHTLFVLVADHGNGLPSDIGNDWPLARHIPLIFTGPAVDPKWRGQRVSTIGGHHDIPATVLTALGIKESFPWSRSLWPVEGKAVQTPTAYYTNEDGIGWVTNDGAGFYNFRSKKWRMMEGELDTMTKEAAQAYLQTLYADFLAL